MSSGLILASGSAARRAMLAGAGVTFDVIPADLDEEAVKAAHTGGPIALALDLARAKAETVSALHPGRLTLGSDQTLAFDGEVLSKARSIDEARERLTAMAGRIHHLHSGVALARDGQTLWSTVETAGLTMRSFSAAFLDDYLTVEGEAALGSVGTYRLEGLGSQLFERIDGDYFTILGMPLWPVLTALRAEGILAT